MATAIFVSGWEGGNLLKVQFVDSGGSPVDISTATEKKLFVKNPNGDTEETSADFSTDGTDGVIEITYSRGELSISGTYRVRGLVVLSGVDLATESSEFTAVEK